MGVLLRVGGVILRAGTIMGLGGVLPNLQKGPRSDDMSTAFVFFALVACVVFVWSAVDGLRWPVTRAWSTWLMATAGVAFFGTVGLPLLLGGYHAVTDFMFMSFLGGLIFVFALIPAVLGAAVGAGVRQVVTKMA